LPKIPSSDTGIVYVPLKPSLSLSYGFFYKDIGKNPLAEKFLSLMDAK
jgi:hypothetical protein